MIKKRILVGVAITLFQIAVFFGAYKLMWQVSWFGLNDSSTVFESLFLDWFVSDYVLVFAILILLQNTLIIITWRKKWTMVLRIITSVLHILFWWDNMSTVYNESIYLGSVGLVLIWLGPVIEELLIKVFNIKSAYRERDHYVDMDAS